MHLIWEGGLRMWSEHNYVNIKEILYRVMRHPLMTNLNLEAAIQYTIDFIAAIGLPNVYIDKNNIVDIREYRGKLPCNCVAINQVKDCKTGAYLTSMTDNFNGTNKSDRSVKTFKTQGCMIYTSFKEGQVDISYKAIPIDDEGLPLLPDNPIFLETLELYIKKKWFTILFDLGEISAAVLQNTQQEYAFKAGQCNNEFLIPSVSEMESITNILNQLVPRSNEFNKGYRHLGDKEYIKVQV